MTEADVLVRLVEQRMGDAASVAIVVLEQAKGGLCVLSPRQVALYTNALRLLDHLHRSVGRVNLPPSLNGGKANGQTEGNHGRQAGHPGGRG